MSLEGRLEKEIEIKAEANRFYNVFRKEMHLLTSVCSQHLKSVELHHGDWETLGSVKHWNYHLDGNALTLKEKVEEVDDENRSITFKVVEGDLLKHQYKHLKVNIQVDPKKPEEDEKDSCIVKWTMEYEKWNDDVPPPEGYMDIAVKATTGIEAHFLNE